MKILRSLIYKIIKIIKNKKGKKMLKAETLEKIKKEFLTATIRKDKIIETLKEKSKKAKGSEQKIFKKLEKDLKEIEDRKKEADKQFNDASKIEDIRRVGLELNNANRYLEDAKELFIEYASHLLENEDICECGRNHDYSSSDDNNVLLELDNIFYKMMITDKCEITSRNIEHEVIFNNKKYFLTRSVITNYSDGTKQIHKTII